MTPKLWLVVAGLVALTTVGFVPHWVRNYELRTELADRQREAPLVTVAMPKPAPDPGLILPGSSLAVQEVILQARGTGYVSRLNVDIGSVVKAGQVLAVLKALDVDAQYHQATSQTHQASATLEQSEVDARRLAAAERQAEAQLSSARGGLVQARATADSYRAKYVSAQRALHQAQANQRQDQAQLVFNRHESERYSSLGKQGYATLEQMEQYGANATIALEKVESDRQIVLMSSANVTDAEAGYRAAVAGVGSAGFNVTAAVANVDMTRQALTVGLRLVDANRAALQAARDNNNRYAAVEANQQIVAPFSGVVTSRNVEVGSLVNASTVAVSDTDPSNTAPTSGLFALARLDPLMIEVQVPQSYYAAMQPGQSVDLIFRELAGEVFHGKVDKVSGALDSMSRTVQVRLRLANPQGRLRPGMYAEAHFSALKLGTVLRVPSTAFMADSHGIRIAIVTPENRVRLQKVDLGRDFGDQAEILTGLKASERVVVTPSDALSDGERATSGSHGHTQSDPYASYESVIVPEGPVGETGGSSS